jgi:hypothetical protein
MAATPIFGAGVSPVEMAMAKKVIVPEERSSINRNPQAAPATTILLLVDAVFRAPVRIPACPGSVHCDLEQWLAFAAAGAMGKTDEYLDNWVYSVSSHQEMLEKRVGEAKLQALRDADTLKEGYYD